MIAGVMRLGDRPVRAVMTPRSEVDLIDLSDDPEAIRRAIVAERPFATARPRRRADDMLGVVQTRDVLDAYLRGERPDIRAHVRPAANVHDTADALDVLEGSRNPTSTWRSSTTSTATSKGSCHERRHSGGDHRRVPHRRRRSSPTPSSATMAHG